MPDEQAREYQELRNSMPAGWFDNFCSKKYRTWYELKEMCPFHVVQLTPDEQYFNIDNIKDSEVAMWLTQYMTTELDVVLVIQGSYHPEGVPLVSSIRYCHMLHDTRISGAIFLDESIAALFKLTFAERLFK